MAVRPREGATAVPATTATTVHRVGATTITITVTITAAAPAHQAVPALAEIMAMAITTTARAITTTARAITTTVRATTIVRATTVPEMTVPGQTVPVVAMHGEGLTVQGRVLR